VGDELAASVLPRVLDHAQPGDADRTGLNHFGVVGAGERVDEDGLLPRRHRDGAREGVAHSGVPVQVLCPVLQLRNRATGVLSVNARRDRVDARHDYWQLSHCRMSIGSTGTSYSPTCSTLSRSFIVLIPLSINRSSLPSGKSDQWRVGAMECRDRGLPDRAKRGRICRESPERRRGTTYDRPTGKVKEVDISQGRNATRSWRSAAAMLPHCPPAISAQRASGS
jgi:hypothetical protein